MCSRHDSFPYELSGCRAIGLLTCPTLAHGRPFADHLRTSGCPATMMPLESGRLPRSTAKDSQIPAEYHARPAKTFPTLQSRLDRCTDRDDSLTETRRRWGETVCCRTCAAPADERSSSSAFADCVCRRLVVEFAFGLKPIRFTTPFGHRDRTPSQNDSRTPVSFGAIHPPPSSRHLNWRGAPCSGRRTRLHHVGAFADAALALDLVGLALLRAASRPLTLSI